jgi:hypothetical protein
VFARARLEPACGENAASALSGAVPSAFVESIALAFLVVMRAKTRRSPQRRMVLLAGILRMAMQGREDKHPG